MSIYYNPTDSFSVEIKEYFEKNTQTIYEMILENNLVPQKGVPHSQLFKDTMSARMMGNTHTLGLKCKPEHIAARAAARCRPIKIEGIVFESGKKAAIHFGVSRALIVKWIKNGKAQRFTSGG